MGNVLTSKAVEAIFEACLFREGEDATDRVDAEGMAKLQSPRWLWSALPGGVPYYVIS